LLRRNNVGEGSSLSPCGWQHRDRRLLDGLGKLFNGLFFLGLSVFLGSVLGLLGRRWSLLPWLLSNNLLRDLWSKGRRSQEGGGVASRYGTTRGSLRRRGSRAGGGGRRRIGKAAHRVTFLLAAHLVIHGDLFYLEGLGIPVARGRKRRKVEFSHGGWFQSHLLGSVFGSIVRGRRFVGSVLAVAVVSSFG